MTQPRVPEDLKADLTEMGLTIWTMHHPIHFDYEWTGNGPKRGRENKAVVHLMLIGPGIDGAQGTGPDVRGAVAAALRHPTLLKRQGGLVGAMAGLELACADLYATMWKSRLSDVELDDDIPF